MASDLLSCPGMEKPKTRTVTLNKKTMRKLNEGELSQAAGGYFWSSDIGVDGCWKCSTSGYVVGKKCTVGY